MSDYIKREDALDACYEETSSKWSTKEETEEGKIIAGVIRSIPSADVVEVRHGHWILCLNRYNYPCGNCCLNVQYVE